MRSNPSDHNFQKELKQHCIVWFFFFNLVNCVTEIICCEPEKNCVLGENGAVVKSKSGQELFNLVPSITRSNVRVNHIMNNTFTY